MSFLEQYDALGSAPDSAPLKIRLLFGALRTDHDALFEELRAKRPIFFTPMGVFLVLFRDVVETLDNDAVFNVSIWGEAMMRNNGGPNFVLGMENSAPYAHDISILRLVVRREDLERVRAISLAVSSKLVGALRQSGRLDVVDFARHVPTLFVGEYFGVPGPTPEVLMTWVRAIFRDIFFNLSKDAGIRDAAAVAAKDLREYVGSLLPAAGAGTPPDNVLRRVVEMRQAFGPAFVDHVAENISGCIVGVIDNVCTAIANVLDELLKRPAEMQRAISAATNGDNATLEGMVLEALRFNCPAPLLIRRSSIAYTLAKGTARQAEIPANTPVLVSTASAMLDETELPNPREFRRDRPAHQYLHFGRGLHQCLGRHIAQTMIVEAVKAVLALQNLRRHPGEKGELKADGPFPLSFNLEFDQVRS